MAGTSSGNITHCTVSVSSKTVMRQYNVAYLSIGLISSGQKQLCSKCAVCGVKLAKQTMVPGKIKRYHQKKHSHLCKKSIEYFERLIVY